MTQCAPSPVSTFPWTENFDAVYEPDLPCGWATEDANNDGYPWTGYRYSGGGRLRVAYDRATTDDKDDWVYTPALILTPGTTYQLTFNTGNTSYWERLTVYMGDAQTIPAMTTQLLDLPQIPYGILTYSGVFTVPATGSYYLGFHAHGSDQEVLMLDNISISEIQPASCYPPVGLGISNVTPTQVTVSWGV